MKYFLDQNYLTSVVHDQESLLGAWQDKYFLCNYTPIIRSFRSVKYSSFMLTINLNVILVCSMESTNLSKANPFLYSWVTFQQNQVKEEKKDPYGC